MRDDDELFSSLDIWKTAKKRNYQNNIRFHVKTKQKLFKFSLFLRFFSNANFFFGALKKKSSYRRFYLLLRFWHKKRRIKFIKTLNSVFGGLDKQWNNNNKFILQSTRELEKITSRLYDFLSCCKELLTSYLLTQVSAYKLSGFFFFAPVYVWEKKTPTKVKHFHSFFS